MPTFETRTTRAAFFGRFADAPSRRTVPRGGFEAALAENGSRPLYKDDGSFAFIDLEPRATPYAISVRGRGYRSREISAGLPTPDAVSLARVGEDELYLTITGMPPSPPPNRVDFAPIPFLPTIAAGAAVIGSGGFTAILAEPLEGEDVGFADLSTVAGLAVEDVLRIVRSDRLLLRPGPYYTFTEPATVVSARFLDDTPAAEPVTGARMAVEQVDGVAITTVAVAGVVLHRVQLDGSPVILGPASAVEAHSNLRGEALLDFPAHLAITSLRLQVSHPDHVPLSQDLTVTAGEVTRWTPPLTPV